jgi:hypothetical protein
MPLPSGASGRRWVVVLNGHAVFRRLWQNLLVLWARHGKQSSTKSSAILHVYRRPAGAGKPVGSRFVVDKAICADKGARRHSPAPILGGIIRSHGWPPGGRPSASRRDRCGFPRFDSHCPAMGVRARGSSELFLAGRNLESNAKVWN